MNDGRERTSTFSFNFIFCIAIPHIVYCMFSSTVIASFVIVAAAWLPKFSFSPTFDLQFDTRVTITWAMHDTSDATSESLSPKHTVKGKSSPMMYNLIAKALAAKPLGKKKMVNYPF